MKNYYRDEKHIIPFKSVVYVWFGYSYYMDAEIYLINKESIGLNGNNAERFLIEYKEWLEDDK